MQQGSAHGCSRLGKGFDKPQMQHLLVVVGEGHGVELADAVVALEHHAGVLPGDRAARLHLSPRMQGLFWTCTIESAHTALALASWVCTPGVTNCAWLPTSDRTDTGPGTTWPRGACRRCRMQCP